MKVEIELKELKRLNLSCEEYALLRLLNTYSLSDIAKQAPGIASEENVKSLSNKGFIVELGDETRVSAKGRDVINDDDGRVENYKMFEELFRRYPTSCVRKNGVKDPLKTPKHACQRKYYEAIGTNKELHAKVMRALEKEIAEKKYYKNEHWWKHLGNWITAKQWEKYDEVVDKSIENNKQAYGTEIS